MDPQRISLCEMENAIEASYDGCNHLMRSWNRPSGAARSSRKVHTSASRTPTEVVRLSLRFDVAILANRIHRG